MCRSIESYITGCQKSSLANTKDVLNILAAKNSIEKEHDEEPIIMRDGREPSGSMLTSKVHVFSDACVLGNLDSVSASETGEQNAEDVMKSDGCKNRRRYCK